MIKRVSMNNKDEVIAFLERKSEEIGKDIYSYDNYAEYLLEDLNKDQNFAKTKGLYAVYKDGNVCDIISSSFLYGVKVLHPFLFAPAEYTIRCIKKYFKKGALVCEEWLNGSKYGLYSCNMQSTYMDCGEEAYFIPDERGLYALKQKETDLYRDAVEKYHFKEFNDPSFTDNITFKVFGKKGWHTYLYKKGGCFVYPMWGRRCSMNTVTGFHYLQPEINENEKVLLAEYKGTPLGAIKYGVYDRDTSSVHYGLCFIDVAAPYQGKGIAKKLAAKLAEVSKDFEYPLALSQESEMGRKCGMEKLFLSQKWSTPIYTSKSWMERKYNG